MPNLSEIMNKQEYLYDISWSSAFGCAVISMLVARTFLRDNSRLFTAMALLACGWMLVLGSYGTPNDLQLLNFTMDIASVLFAYVGALLVAEAKSRSANEGGHTWEQDVAMGLLIFAAVPTAI